MIYRIWLRGRISKVRLSRGPEGEGGGKIVCMFVSGKGRGERLQVCTGYGSLDGWKAKGELRQI